MRFAPRRALPLLFTLSLSLSLSLISPAVTSSASAADVVARVGSAPVAAAEIRAYLQGLPEADREALAGNPAVLSQTVRAYLVRRMVLAEAREQKFEDKPETQAQLARLREEALAELFLQSAAALPEGVPSEAEIKAAYAANKAALMMPRRYRLAQVFIAAAKGDAQAEAAGRDKLAALTRKLRARGADFAAVAKEYSDNAAEAARGGEIGWVPEDRIVGPIRDAAAGLAKGAVSNPIRLDDGWHVVRLLDTKPAGPRAFEEVRESLRAQLRRTAQQKARKAYLDGLLKRHPTAIDELALSRLAEEAAK